MGRKPPHRIRPDTPPKAAYWEYRRNIPTRSYDSLTMTDTPTDTYEVTRGKQTIETEHVNTSAIEEGDTVRLKPSRNPCASDKPVHDDGYQYAKVRRPDTDQDGDGGAWYLDEGGDKIGSGFIRLRNTELVTHAPHLGVYKDPHDTDETPEWLDDDDRSEADTLAVLQEEEENLVQMQELQARTAAPGILELPVGTVSTAANSPKWAIDIEHPVLDDLRFHYEKPVAGWSDDYDITELLTAYGIFDANVFKLQTREVYVEHTGGDPEMSGNWKIRLPSEVEAESGGVTSSHTERPSMPSLTPWRRFRNSAPASLTNLMFGVGIVALASAAVFTVGTSSPFGWGVMAAALITLFVNSYLDPDVWTGEG